MQVDVAIDVTRDAMFQALKGIDLAIRTGEFVAIMGPSGSGKSTLMNILGCLDTATTGSYRYQGIAVEGLDNDQRDAIHEEDYVRDDAALHAARRVRS